MPHDLMHDVFEGVVPVELKLLLDWFIRQGYFTYEFYSQQLVSFNYGYCDTNKPVPMTKRSYIANDKTTSLFFASNASHSDTGTFNSGKSSRK